MFPATLSQPASRTITICEVRGVEAGIEISCNRWHPTSLRVFAMKSSSAAAARCSVSQEPSVMGARMECPGREEQMSLSSLDLRKLKSPFVSFVL